MAAFPLSLTFDKRMTPPPVGCQGDWAVRADAPAAGLAVRANAPAAHFAGFASFGRSLLMSRYRPGKVRWRFFMRGMMVTSVGGGGDG
jgi:hypothetical protein